MGTKDARIHTGGDDFDGGAGGRRRHSAESIFALAASQGETDPRAIFRLALELANALAKAEARHESVDGVHSRDARQET